jgi:hypothetical protein
VPVKVKKLNYWLWLARAPPPPHPNLNNFPSIFWRGGSGALPLWQAPPQPEPEPEPVILAIAIKKKKRGFIIY